MTSSVSSGSYRDQPVDAGGLVDVRTVATLCGCSTRHIRRLTDAGRMPAPVRLGSLIRWRRSDVEAWIADGCRPVRTATANARGGVR